MAKSLPKWRTSRVPPSAREEVIPGYESLGDGKHCPASLLDFLLRDRSDRIGSRLFVGRQARKAELPGGPTFDLGPPRRPPPVIYRPVRALAELTPETVRLLVGLASISKPRVPSYSEITEAVLRATEGLWIRPPLVRRVIRPPRPGAVSEPGCSAGRPASPDPAARRPTWAAPASLARFRDREPPGEEDVREAEPALDVRAERDSRTAEVREERLRECEVRRQGPLVDRRRDRLSGDEV